MQGVPNIQALAEDTGARFIFRLRTIGIPLLGGRRQKIYFHGECTVLIKEGLKMAGCSSQRRPSSLIIKITGSTLRGPGKLKAYRKDEVVHSFLWPNSADQRSPYSRQNSMKERF